VPPKLRKDLWKPLYTVTIPRVPNAFPALSAGGSEATPLQNAQGLDAFSKLREYRRLHELYWEPTEELSRKYSKAEIEKLDEAYEKRGGSKKESVYDIIKREKKKLRRGIVMDQKANSVADLATVLLTQERDGEVRYERQLEERRDGRRREVVKMLRYAREVEDNGLEFLDGEIEERNMVITKMKGDKAAEQDGPSRTQMKQELHVMRKRRQAMAWASEEVKRVLKRLAASHAYVRRMREEEGLLVLPADRGDMVAEAEAMFRALESRWPSLEQYRESAEELDREAEGISAETSPGENHSELVGSMERAASRRVEIQVADKEIGVLDASAEQISRTRKMYARLEAELRKKRREMKDSETRSNRDAHDWALLRQMKMLRLKLEALEHLFTTRGVGPQAHPLLHIRRGLGKASEVGVAQKGDVEATTDAATTSSEPAESLRDLEDTDPDASPLSPFPAFHELLRSFPHPTTDSHTLLRHDKLRHKLRWLNAPVFRMEGVKVQWANILDAEFAQEWPEGVEHEYMGLTRHTAKHPKYKAKMTVLETKPWLEERAIARGEIEVEEVDEDEADVEVGKADAEAVALAKREGRKAKKALEAEERKKVVEGLALQMVGKLQEPEMRVFKTRDEVRRRRKQDRDRRATMQARAVAEEEGRGDDAGMDL